MARQTPKRKCKHCQTFFVPDPRGAKRQRYYSTPQCRQLPVTHNFYFRASWSMLRA